CAASPACLIGSRTNDLPPRHPDYSTMNAPALGPLLAHGLSFDDLHDRNGLARLDAAFVAWLESANPVAHARLMAARAAPDALAAKDESNLLIEVARPLEDFVGSLFGVAAEAATLRA